MKMDPRTLSPRSLHRGALLELTHHWIMDGDLQVPPKGSESWAWWYPRGHQDSVGWRQEKRGKFLLLTFTSPCREVHTPPPRPDSQLWASTLKALATEGVKGSRNNTLPQKYGLCPLHVILMWQKRKKKAVNPSVGSTGPLKRIEKSQFPPLH